MYLQNFLQSWRKKTSYQYKVNEMRPFAQFYVICQFNCLFSTFFNRGSCILAQM